MSISIKNFLDQVDLWVGMYVWRVDLTVNLSDKFHSECRQHCFMGWTLNCMRRREPTALVSSLRILKEEKLIVGYSFRGLESMTIMVGSMVTDKHGPGAVAESLWCDPHHKVERAS